MVRSSCKSLFNSIAELHPFPKHFILDPSACAAYFVQIGSISCLEYCKNSLNFFFAVDLAIKAVEYNNFSLLKYLHDNGCQFNPMVILQAAHNGDLEMMKYCHENTYKSEHFKNDYGGLLCNAAAAGNLQVLKYLIELGYKWENYAGYMASNANSLDCLEYLIDNGFNGDVQTIRSLEMMKFLNQNGLEWKSNACKFAVMEKNMDMLKYAHEHGSPWNDAVSLAIHYGALDCLKYMIANSATIIQPVAVVGSLDVLKYLIKEHNVVFLPDLYSKSVENMQKDVLEYLPQIIDLARPNSLGTSAAGLGDLEFLKWCIEDQHYDTDINNDGYDSIDVLQAALSSGSFEVVKYVIEKNLGPRTMTIAENINNGALDYWFTTDIWEYLYNIQPFDINEDRIRSQIQTGCVDVLEWMERHGAIFTEQHINIAIQVKSLRAMAYLLKKGLWSPTAVSLLGDDVDLLRYLVYSGNVTLGPELYHDAKQKGHKNILAYLQAQEAYLFTGKKDNLTDLLQVSDSVLFLHDIQTRVAFSFAYPFKQVTNTIVYSVICECNAMCAIDTITNMFGT